jgi:hypothetical protein
MVWLYVPDMEDLKSPSSEFSQHTEPFVMWRGKPLLPNTLSKRWKKGGWVTRLSGLMCEPLTVSLGVERWISSLEVSRVNPIQVLESNWPKEIQETYGTISSELLGRCDQASYSLKTFQASLNGDLNKLSLTSINSGMMLRGVLSQLPKLGLHIKESDGFSSVFPTPVASDGKRSNDTYGGGNLTLKGAVKLMPTPTTQGNASLAGQYNKNTGTTLAGYAQMFPTPTTGEAKYRLKGNSQASNCLAVLAKKGALTDGTDHLTHGGKLNPQWVAWLMGLPIGWINSEYWGTE